MTKRYHTVCTFDPADLTWYDCVGFYSLADAKVELEDTPCPRCIITHDDSADAMMAARDALPIPARYRKG